MSCYKYLELPDYRKIPMIKEDKNKKSQLFSKPEFCGKFIELWELLYDVGISDAPTYSGVVDSFSLPSKSLSKLVGTPAIVDPTSPVRLYSFVNKDLDGPIINNGYSLQTYNDEVFYEIKWKINEDLDNFIIGFYRSDGFINETTNTFSLICGNLGASIFRRSCGKIVIPGISNLFVAANQDTTIELEVKVVIPDKIVYPSITTLCPYTKFITIQDCSCKNIQIAVYRMFAFGEGNVVKEPSKYFVEAAKVIKNYLRNTGLSITLLPDKPIVKSLMNKSIPECYDCVYGCSSEIIQTIEYNPSPKSGSASITTKPIYVCNTDYYILGVPRGIKLNTPPDKVAKVSYRIKINAKNLPSYDADVRVQYKSGGLFYTHNKLDTNGNIDGTAETTVNIQPGSERDLIETYKLPLTSTAFAITVYYTITANTSPREKEIAINTLMEKSTFDLIRIEYVDNVL